MMPNEIMKGSAEELITSTDSKSNSADNTRSETSSSVLDKNTEQISSSVEQECDSTETIRLNEEDLNNDANDTDSLCSSPQSDNASQESTANDLPSNGCAESDGQSDDEPFDWTPYAELHLLNSLRGLRPVGVYYHFYLSMIHERFTQAMGVNISINELRNKLNTYYNFDEALKISGEDFPCPQSEFNLPLDEFPEVAEIMARMEKEGTTSTKAKSNGD